MNEVTTRGWDNEISVIRRITNFTKRKMSFKKCHFDLNSENSIIELEPYLTRSNQTRKILNSFFIF